MSDIEQKQLDLERRMASEGQSRFMKALFQTDAEGHTQRIAAMYDPAGAVLSKGATAFAERVQAWHDWMLTAQANRLRGQYFAELFLRLPATQWVYLTLDVVLRADLFIGLEIHKAAPKIVRNGLQRLVQSVLVEKDTRVRRLDGAQLARAVRKSDTYQQEIYAFESVPARDRTKLVANYYHC
jgi:hypothetical protein